MHVQRNLRTNERKRLKNIVKSPRTILTINYRNIFAKIKAVKMDQANQFNDHVDQLSDHADQLINQSNQLINQANQL